MTLSATDVASILASVVYVTVGTAILYLGPRRPLNWAFAVFAVANGLNRLFFVEEVDTAVGAEVADFLFDHLRVAWALALVAIAFLFPRPLPRTAWAGALTVPVLLGLVTLVHQVLGGFVDGPSTYFVVLAVIVAGAPFIGHLFAARVAATRGSDPETHRLILLAGLFLIVPGIHTGVGLFLTAQDGQSLWLMTSIVAIRTGGALVLWLWAADRAATAVVSRGARNLALLTIGIPLVTMVALSLLGADLTQDSLWATLEIASVLFMLALAHAIVRHRLLDIDVKVRWGISRSTVAGAFVAVFFIASEGAQLVFGQQNEVVGLFAAGALVFAIAPLQRAAERLAEKAVPVDLAGTPPSREDDPEAVFRQALRLALRDTDLSREEEGHLFRLARSLRIDAARAHELLADVEREQERGA